MELSPQAIKEIQANLARHQAKVDAYKLILEGAGVRVEKKPGKGDPNTLSRRVLAVITARNGIAAADITRAIAEQGDVNGKTSLRRRVAVETYLLKRRGKIKHIKGKYYAT